MIVKLMKTNMTKVFNNLDKGRVKIRSYVTIVIGNGKIVWKHRPSTNKSLWYFEIYRTAQNTGDQFEEPRLALKGIRYWQELFMLLWIKYRG